MEKFITLDGVAAPFPMINCDTDRIIPARFLKTIKRIGLGVNLFNDVRYNDDGSEVVDFVLNKPAYREAKLLVAGANFGCGASREHAPWALSDFGIYCVIAPSFGDKFYDNCFQNNLLAARVSEQTATIFNKEIERCIGLHLRIKIDTNSIESDRTPTLKFELDTLRGEMLTQGLDPIAATLTREQEISNFEKIYLRNHTWAQPN